MEEKAQRIEVHEIMKQSCSWGFKFEQYMTSDNPKEANPDGPLPPVIEPEAFSCVFKGKIGNFSVIYGADVDGFKISDSARNCQDKVNLDLNQETIVEFKTRKRFEHSGHEKTFRRFKILEWWAQSHLVGIPKIVCGIGDSTGIVSEVKEFNVADLPILGSQFWNSNVCMNFLQKFLGFVKTVLDDLEEETVVEFDFDRHSKLVTQKVNTSFDQEFFLPKWFKSNTM